MFFAATTTGRSRQCLAAGVLILAMAGTAHAAPTPSSGTLSTVVQSIPFTGGLISGANVDETTCMDDVTCETFTLTLAPGDYTGLRIRVDASWLVPANDYDVYIHEGTLAGPVVGSSAGGAPGTIERANVSIDPPVVTVAKVYAVRIVAFSVTPGDNYAGLAALVPTPLPRQPIYLSGHIKFSQNVTLRAPVASSDGEPSVRVDVRGNCYVGGIRGVPAGVDLWRIDLDPNSPTFDPGMQNATYLGQPDAFLPQDPNDPMAGGADGGGDIDISVSFPTSPSATPVVTITSLAAANISSAVSSDRGVNFTLSPATAIAPADDRQWNESTGDNRVYMLYRAPIPATGLFVQRSDNSGFSYPTIGVVSPSGSTPGYIDVDHANGAVYVSHSSSSTLFIGRSDDFGVTWRNTTADNTTQHGNLFDPVKVGLDGTVYTAWSDGHNIYMAHSSDGGQTFSDKVRVNDNSLYQTNLFPWLEAGSAGRVSLVWYGTTAPVNDDSADWVVLYTQTLNATDPNPTFRQQVISDHVIHGSNISTGGLTGGANRNLIDYFQVALDPQGASVVAFTDDHNDFDGHTYVTRQLEGTSLYASANNNSGLVRAVIPPLLPAPDPNDPEVSDFTHDAVAGLLQPIPEDNPFDVLWVDYSCEAHPMTAELMLVAAMKVSGSLDPLPAGANWRMNFAANASQGVSDRGDQFYVRLNADVPAMPVYTWGTAVRAGDGSVTYTSRGTPDFGSVDIANNIITIKVKFASLNAFVSHGPPIASGTTFWGLRGSAFTSQANLVTDQTRGGSFFTCGNTSDVPPDDTGDGRPVAAFLGAPVPNPSRGAAQQVRFAIDRPGWVELSVFDAAGRRVRTVHAGPMARGEHVRTWDGRTDRFAAAAPGVYFMVLRTAAGQQSCKVTRMP